MHFMRIKLRRSNVLKIVYQCKFVMRKEPQLFKGHDQGLVCWYQNLHHYGTQPCRPTSGPYRQSKANKGGGEGKKGKERQREGRRKRETGEARERGERGGESERRREGRGREAERGRERGLSGPHLLQHTRIRVKPLFLNEKEAQALLFFF